MPQISGFGGAAGARSEGPVKATAFQIRSGGTVAGHEPLNWNATNAYEMPGEGIPSSGRGTRWGLLPGPLLRVVMGARG